VNSFFDMSAGNAPNAGASVPATTPSNAAPGIPLEDLTKDSPRRPPNWRFEKARALRQSKREPSRCLDDNYIATIMEFQDIMERVGNDEWARLALFERYPDITQAVLTHATGNENGRATRWDLEARLLADNATFEDISERLCISVGAITWYERLFYNVRDRLKAMSWVAHHALGAKIHMGLGDQDYGLVWKILGYCGGMLMVDDVVTVMSRELLTDPTMTEKYYSDAARAVAIRQALMAALTLRPRDQFAKVEVMNLAHRYRELEMTLSGGGGGNDKLNEGLHMAMQNVKFSLIKTGKKLGINRLLENGVERRVKDVLLANAGFPVTIDPDQANAKFPEVKRLLITEQDTDDGPKVPDEPEF
jgi:hypothetical protein